uniref:Uncharacterized protein n=1 Tax=Rhizophora mucronata TaxID=61149 RepID=A0A2P2MYC9_RHIMU
MFFCWYSFIVSNATMKVTFSHLISVFLLPLLYSVLPRMEPKVDPR